MKKVLIGLGVVVLLLAAAFPISTLLSPSSEVVVLVTQNGGDVRETTLWIIEEGSHLWLRGGNPTSSWVNDLRTNAEVELERSDVRKAYKVEFVETPEARDRINAAMAEKYGLSDQLVGLFGGARDESVPLRLVVR